MAGDGRNERLVAALEALSASGRAEWVRRPVDPEFVFCFLGDDLITFDLQGPGAASAELVGAIHGIGCDFRNCAFLWLEDLDGWQQILGLLRKARVDEAHFQALRRGLDDAVLRSLEERAGAPNECRSGGGAVLHS